MNSSCGARIHITGIVQGVGFRPFVYGLAARLALTGWVRNTSAGVDIEVDGPPQAIADFIRLLRDEQPPLARIDTLEMSERPANGYKAFEIFHSEPVEGAFQPISPDVCVCADCLNELRDPHDRRYGYPFINCTNCGPRFTIITDIPYDRPNTTMASFKMCPECAAEYANPRDRRFHAQPVACPQCGPHVWLEYSHPETGDGNQHSESSQHVSAGRETGVNQTTAGSSGREAILQAQKLLAQGKILAVKGLGGFHLACAATQPQAVAELRRRKLRVDKPFALMMPDIETVRQYCEVSRAESDLLQSIQRPIVVLRRKPGSPIAPEVAPDQDTLGVMLPYTPLHDLLFMGEPGGGLSASHFPSALVMTSGNLSEEPIATGNAEARQRLAGLADAFLMHNRDIRTRCDDSVVRVFSGPIFLRRSRGYAPDPVLLAAEQVPTETPPLLAAGAELKNTFCLTRDRYAFMSHHIGDLENWETLRAYEESIAHFERLFRIQPQAVAYDLHPNYLATRYALERAAREKLPAIGVQHHHAHLAACMAEHALPDEPVIGAIFDGTGYGEDGAIWGGEFLVAGYRDFQRLAHLAYVPLPGGDAAVRNPARTALAHLWAAGMDWDPGLPCTQALCAEDRQALRAMLEHRLNSPLTSSMGRLFDAAASAAGLRHKVNYEAQAAIELEALVDPAETGAYGFDLQAPPPGTAGEPGRISPTPLWEALAADVLSGVSIPRIAARFHNGVAEMVASTCEAIRQDTGIHKVILSGGVWQNFTLLGKTLPRLQRAGFTVLLPRQLPPNDGGLALGQAMVAFHRLRG